MESGTILLLVAFGFAVYGYITSIKGKTLGAIAAFFMIGTPAGFLVAGMSTGALLAWVLALTLTITFICVTKREQEKGRQREK